MDYVALGKRIRKLRQSRKWTQAELAQQLGLSISFLGHIERGSRKASLETMVAISNTLGAGLDYLLSDSLVEQPAAPGGAQLSEKQRVFMRQIVQHISENLDAWIEDDPE